MPSREALVSRHTALDELKTIQMLEESIGPKSIRQLRRMMESREARDVLESVARESGAALRELDDVVHEWATHAQPEVEPHPMEAEALDVEEILSSVIELKENEAQLLKRAANDAPTAAMRERLEKLAKQAASAAERLHALIS